MSDRLQEIRDLRAGKKPDRLAEIRALRSPKIDAPVAGSQGVAVKDPGAYDPEGLPPNPAYKDPKLNIDLSLPGRLSDELHSDPGQAVADAVEFAGRYPARALSAGAGAISTASDYIAGKVSRGLHKLGVGADMSDAELEARIAQAANRDPLGELAKGYAQPDPTSVSGEVGSGLGMIGTSMAFGPENLVGTGAAIGAAETGVANYHHVLAVTGDEDKAFLGLLQGAGVGAAGAALPLDRLNKASGGMLSKALTDALVFSGAAMAQSAVNDVVLEVATGEDLDKLNRAVQSGMLGALTGAIAGAVGHAMMERAASNKSEKVPDSAKTDIGEPQKPDASFKVTEPESGAVDFARGDDTPPEAKFPKGQAESRGEDMPPDAGLGMFKETPEDAALSRIAARMKAAKEPAQEPLLESAVSKGTEPKVEQAPATPEPAKAADTGKLIPSLQDHLRVIDEETRARNEARKASAPQPKPASRAESFLSDMSPMARKRAENALDNSITSGGKPYRRSELVESMVDEGATVVLSSKGARRLQRPNGAYLDESQISKTAMDYAERLVSDKETEKPKPEPVVEQAPVVEGKPVPPEVLADYPDLVSSPKPAPEKTAPAPDLIYNEVIKNAATGDLKKTTDSDPFYYRVLNDIYGLVGGVEMTVDKIFRSDKAKAFSSGFDKTRDEIRKQHGDHVRLYRYQDPEHSIAEKPTLLFSDKAQVHGFRRDNRKLISLDVSVDDIFSVGADENGYREFVVDISSPRTKELIRRQVSGIENAKNSESAKTADAGKQPDYPDLKATPKATEKPELARLKEASDTARAALDALGPEPPKPSNEKRAFGSPGREGASPEAVARYDAEVKAHTKWRRQYSKLQKADLEAGNAYFYAKQKADAKTPKPAPDPAPKAEKPATAPDKAIRFDVGEKVVWRAPGTGKDVLVDYRGDMAGGKSVVVPDSGLQMSVERSALRRQGDEYVAPVDEPKAKTAPEPEAKKEPRSKLELIEEFIGKKPDTRLNPLGAVRWESDKKLYAKSTVKELRERLVERNKDREVAQQVYERAKKASPAFADIAEKAGARWFSAINEALESFGISKIPNNARKDESVVVASRKFAEILRSNDDGEYKANVDLLASRGLDAPDKAAALDAKIDTKIKEIGRKGRGKARSGLPDPELLKDVTELAGLYVKKAGYTAEKFVQELVNRFGEPIRAYAEEAWNAVKPKEETTAEKPKSIPKEEPVAEKPKSAPEPKPFDAPETTSVKNRKMDELADEFGVEHATTDDVLSDQSALDTAKERIKDDPEYVKNLMLNLRTSERGPSKVEHAALGVEIRKIANERAAAQKEYADAKTDQERAIAALKADEIQARFNEIQLLSRSAGADVARSLQGRKGELDSNFELAQLEFEMQRSKGDEPLTKQEREALADLAIEHRKARDIIAMEQAARDELLAEKESERWFTEYKAKAPKESKAKSPSRRTFVEDYISKKADEARARLKSGNVARDVTGVFSDAAWIGADIISKGARSFADWVKQMHLEIAERDEGKLKELYAESQKALHSSMLEAIGERAAKRFKSGRGFGKYADLIARRIIDSGVQERDAVISGVHDVLKKIDPNLTFKEARDLLSGYGKRTKLSQDETSRILRDIKGQSQQLAKIDALEARRAPLQTGPERREPSPAERALIKKVNKLKKGLNIKTIEPENAIKTAIETKKRRLENQIEDYQHAIDTGEAIVKNDEPTPSDSDTKTLEFLRDQKKKEYEDIFGDGKKTEVEVAKDSIKAIESSIKEYERKIAENDIARKAEKQGPPTAEMDSLNRQRDVLLAHRKALAAELAEMRDLADGKQKLTKDQISVKSAITRDLQREANLYERIWYQDFAPRERREVPETPELIDARTRKRRAEQMFQRAKRKAEFENKTDLQKGLHYTKEGVGVASDILTSGDLPPILRQGGFFFVNNPIKSGKAFADSFEAMWTKEGAERVRSMIEGTPEYEILEKNGTQFTGYHDPLSPMEENIRATVSEHIPIVAHTQRGFAAFLNLQRLYVGRALLRAVENPSKEDLRSISDFINVGTGRGGFKNKKLDAGLNLVKIPLFAPRLYLSRISLMSGATYRASSPRVKRIVGKSMARMGAAIAAVSTLAYLMGNKDAFDLRSSDAGQIVVGDTRIDLTAQFRQYAVLLGRFATHEIKHPDGEITDVGDDWELASDFLDTKKAPALNAFIEIRKAASNKPGRSGKIESVMSATAKAIAPISPMDVYRSMRSEGVPTGLAISILGMIGAGVNTYQQKKKIPPYVSDSIKRLRAAGMHDRANDLYNMYQR